jgi:hypothetical protein
MIVADDPTDPVIFEDYSALQREGYEAGDKDDNKAALLQMILICVQDQRPLPDWAGTAFEKVYHKVLTGEFRSWDDVFGKPHPKGRHLNAVRLENQMWEVYARVRDIHKKDGVPINNELFEHVGTELGLGGRTTVSELYGIVQHILNRLREEGHEVREF